MRLVLRRAAKRDLAEARRWYDERRAGLGKEFLSCVEATLSILRNHPYMFPRVDPRVRRATVERFPYGIFYSIDGETVRVLAVLHNARGAHGWKSRVEDP
ncbi:MAG: type II toxin-antitoxin system RelE/ParE family toxin [Thermoanaerobaculia bacterium]